MVFEMSIQDFDDQTQDHLFPHRNGGVDYREGSFISEEVKGYQEPGVYHSDSQVGTVFIRISVPELKLQKCLQFELDETVWQAKQRILGSFAKDLKDAVNYGLYCPPMNGRAGKFLDEERLLREYPLQGPIGFLEFKYKKRVYKMMHVNVRKLKQLHVKGNLRHFIDYVKTGNLEKVNKMTNKGLDPNFHDSGTGETPLCLAVSMCKPKCRELIISLAGGGAHLDFRNKKGMTALHVAVVAGNLEAIKTLLDLGVSPNLKDSRSLTPLYYTVSHCTSPSCMEMLLQERAFIGSQDEQGWFEIHHACRQGLVQHLEHLLFYGADMDVQNASGNTALHVCALHNRESCLRVLLFRGANKEILNYSNQSPYECAILAGNNAIAEILEGHKDDDVVQFRETPRFSTRRRDSVASAAMYALYRSRSDPRINHILISPSSSTQSFSHLHNSQTTTDSYSGSRGTDSPCSMSLSSSSSGPGFFGKGASASFPLRRPMSVCQSHFPDQNRPSLSQFEIMKRRLTPANSFRSVRSRDQLEQELHRDLHRRLSLQFEIRKRGQFYQNLTVPHANRFQNRNSEQGINSQSTMLSPSMESINSVQSQTPSLSTFSSHSGKTYGSCLSVGDNTLHKRERSKSPNLPIRNTVCTSDSTIYRVISKPKKHRTSIKNQTQVGVNKHEDGYGNANIYTEISSKCKGPPSNNRNPVGRQTSAPVGDTYISSYISADHCPPEATLELEVDHIYVCTERYLPRTPDELALEKGDIVEVLGVGEQGFWEGRVNNNEGMFPSNFVQEVKLRRKAGSLGDLVSASRHDMMLNRNTLAAIVPNFSEYAPRSVVLQKGPEGYGFVLRGAKSQTQATAELDFRPSAEFPALQYLDSVDPGSRADRAGLKTGDFILEINGENVVRASHDRVVQLIRQAGDTLALKVVTVKPLEKPEHWLQHHNGTMTLPNRGGARRQAPQPPQRDPQTSLSVGKAQGKQYAEGMAELDQLDLALAEYEKQTVQSVVSSEQKTASIRNKHSAKRVSCVELDKIENPDSKSATSKGKAKDYMSPSEIRIQKYHHQKKNGNLERSSSTPSLVDKKEAVYATPTVPPTEQNDMGHRRSSSGAAVSHIYATPGERPRAPPPPPPANATQSSPKRPAPAPPRPQSEIVSISTDRRKSSSSITDSLPSSDKPSSEYESSFRPGISAQLSTEPKISTPSLQQVKLRSHNRNSSQVSLQSNDSGGSKRSEEKLGVTFADDKIQDHANQFLQKHPNAQLLVTADVHAKNKDRKVSEPEPDYDSDESDAKTNKVTVISVGGGIDASKKFTVKSDIPSGGGGRIIPPPPSEPAPKPPSHKPPSPLPKPVKQDVEVRYSPLSDKKLDVDSNMKNFETSSVKSEEPLYSTVTKSSEPEPPKAPPAPPAPPPPPPAPPAPGVSAPVEKPKTPPPPVMEKKPKAAVQGIPSKDIMEAVLLRKTRIESEGMKISKGPNKEAPVKDGNDLRNRMLDNTHSAILAAVAKRRALLEEKDSDHSVAEEIENRLQKTKKLQSAKYFFSSETIQKKEGEKTNKIETKAENGPKEITPTIVKPATPTTVSSKTTKPPSPVPSKKTKPPSPAPVRKISPPTPGAKTLPSATKSTTSAASTAGVVRTVEKTQAAPKPIYSSSAKPPSPKLKKAPSPVPVKSPVAETASDKPKETKSETLANTEKDDAKKERDENEDLLAKAEKARLDWLQKKSSTTSLKSPRDVARNPSKLNSPRRTASKAGANTEGTNAKKETSSPTKSTPKTNGMTLPLKTEPNNTSVQPKAKSPVQTQPAKSTEKSGITPMKTTKESDLLLKNKNIRDRIANFEKGKPVVNGKSDPDSKIPVHGVTVDSSVTDKSPALPPPPEFGDSVQLEIIPPPSGFNLSDNLESPTYNSAFHHSDSSSVSTLSTLSDDHVDAKMKHSYEDLIAPPPPGFGDNNEDSLPSVIPPPPDFGESKPGVKSNQTVNKPFLSKPLSSWQCLDVLDWLDSIQMAQYKKSFQQHCIDGKKLGGLQRNDYIQLGVTQVGHRMTMERAIKKASNIITGTHL